MSKSLIYVTNSCIKTTEKNNLKDKCLKIYLSLKVEVCNGFNINLETINTFENEENIFIKEDVKIEILKVYFIYCETKVDWKEDII